MWSNVISVDKNDEEIFGKVLKKIESIRELSSAVEESKWRNYIFMAGLCEYADSLRDRVEGIVADAILTEYKMAYYTGEIKYGRLTYAAVALLSTLVYLDYDLEKAFIRNVLSELSGYDVDAIFRFRLRALRATWCDIAEMCNRLFEDGTDDADIYNVIGYISATKNARHKALHLSGNPPRLTCDETGDEVEILRVFGNISYDLINTVIATSATHLIVDGYTLDKDALRALKHIIRVKIV